MADFLDMGGYAVFVWASYAIVALALVGLWLRTRRAARQAAADVVRLRERIMAEGEGN